VGKTHEVAMSIVEEIALRQSIRFGLLVVGVLASLIYAVFFCHRSPSVLKTVVKTIPMPAFAAAVAVSFGSWVVVVALLLSALGDLALSRDGEKAFLVGLISFAAAHVAYVVYFWDIGAGPLAMPVLLMALVVVALSTERWLSPFTESLKWPVRAYVVIICAMGATAFGLVDRPLAVAGAVAFMASDTLLAIQLFRMKSDASQQRMVSTALWVLYAGGQFLIVAGVGWATPLF
jgi:uncharacterized membrane protein YhhN